MHMVAVNVLVLHDKIWHFSKTHLLHVLVCEACKVGVAQTVVWVRVERDVHHRLFGAGCRRHPAQEIIVCPTDIHRAAAVVEYLVGVKHPAFLLVDFLPVVCDCPVQRTA